MHNYERVASAGFSAVPEGHLATIVTSLEMFSLQDISRSGLPEGVALCGIDGTDLARYRKLYRRVGEEWLWFSRLVMDDRELAAILNDSEVEIYALREDGEDIGILELDFRVPGECELAFFGLAPHVTGKGLGRDLMNMAITLAWSRPINRFWVHTCTLDHPAALSFYIRSGFRPYARHIEVAADPRLTGHIEEDKALHVPLIAPTNHAACVEQR
ncbi:TPA: GNAT family N-acetyltransferase [Enterobacter bugandensis]